MKALRTAIVVLAASLTLAFGGSAGAESNSDGNSHYAPGQVTAEERCNAVIDRQEARGIGVGGGPKSWFDEAPTNCDHFYN